MSTSEDPREGLSPSPANLLDIFTGDEDDDDVDSYHPTEEHSTDASGLEDDESDVNFTGTNAAQLTSYPHSPLTTLQMHKRH